MPEQLDRRTVLSLGLTLGITSLASPANDLFESIKELLMPNLPGKIAGVYWTNWNSGIRLTQVPASYNLQYLFAASKSGSEGNVSWGVNVSADIKTVRARGQKIILSCGGAGNGINFSDRSVSTRFVDAITRINTELGGTLAAPVLDGVDFNTFEANATPNAPEYLWVVYELRRRFGPGFGVTSPPAPWSDVDKQFCKAMFNGGAMDYCAPQYYDGPGLSDPNYIVSNVEGWISDVAGGDASKVVVGFGMAALPNYSTVDQIKNAWNRIESAHPNIRGAFVWQHKTDSDTGWSFANQIIPLIDPSATTTPPVVVPPPAGTGKQVTIGLASYPLAGTNIARGADELVVYSTGGVTTTNVYGAEAAVSAGRIASVVDRQTTNGPGLAIPQGGYVLSGHGAARNWLLAEAQVGDLVTGDVPAFTSPYVVPKDATLAQLIDKHNALVKKLGL